jgi:hypothetical protein
MVIIVKKVMAKYRESGLLDTLKGVYIYVKNILFAFGVYNVYEVDLSPLDYSKLETERESAKVIAISNLYEFDRLRNEGYKFFPRVNPETFSVNGVIAFCVFVEKIQAHVTFTAVNKESKKHIDPIPFPCNYRAGEVCSGRSYTDLQFRGKNYQYYAYSFLLTYMAERGYVKDKFTIEVNNIASQKGVAKFSKIVSKGMYLRLFNLTIWKELPR